MSIAVLLVRRRRLVALRVCVGVLCVVAVAAWLAHLQTRATSRTPKRKRFVATSSVGVVHGAPHAKQGSQHCPLGTFFEPQYPVICSFGVPVAFVRFGGRPLEGGYWIGAEEVLALLLFKHSPLLPLPPLGEFPRLTWILCEGSVYGTVSTEIGTLSKLRVLSLWRNQITTLPTQLGLLSVLELNLDNNPQLHGPIPSEFAAITTLTSLVLIDLDLGGTVHSTLGLIPALRLLHLDRLPVTSTIPTDLGRLTALERLYIPETNLSGPVPSQLGSLERLIRFNVSLAEFSGTIPSQLGRLYSLTDLSFAGNRFTGPVPSQLGLLSSAAELYFHDNELEGPIPSQLALLNVTTLTLASNVLTGTVPLQLASMQRLTFLDVSDNLLSGSLPPFPGHVEVLCDNSGLDDPKCPAPPPAFVDSALVWAVVALASVELLVVLATGVQVFVHRAVPVIRATNPLFSVLTLLSLVLAISALFPFALTMADAPHATRERACVAMVHLGSHGLTLLPCCITIRSYPIWRIFVGNPELQRVTLAKAQLLRPVCANVVVAAVLATLVGLGIRAKRGVGCEVDTFRWAVYALLAYTLALAVSAAYISVRIRNVPSKFNDTQNIAKATYLLLTFGVAMVCVGSVASDPTPRFLAWSLCVLLCVASFTGLVHVTKLLSLNKADPGTVVSDGRVRS